MKTLKIAILILLSLSAFSEQKRKLQRADFDGSWAPEARWKELTDKCNKAYVQTSKKWSPQVCIKKESELIYFYGLIFPGDRMLSRVNFSYFAYALIKGMSLNSNVPGTFPLALTFSRRDHFGAFASLLLQIAIDFGFDIESSNFFSNERSPDLYEYENPSPMVIFINKCNPASVAVLAENGADMTRSFKRAVGLPNGRTPYGGYGSLAMLNCEAVIEIIYHYGIPQGYNPSEQYFEDSNKMACTEYLWQNRSYPLGGGDSKEYRQELNALRSNLGDEYSYSNFCLTKKYFGMDWISKSCDKDYLHMFDRAILNYDGDDLSKCAIDTMDEYFKVTKDAISTAKNAKNEAPRIIDLWKKRNAKWLK